MNIPSSSVEAALFYASEGFSIIPIIPGTKKPYINWLEYTQHIASEEEIIKWGTFYGNFGIALVTGRLSGVVAVDIDSEEAIATYKEHFPETSVFNITGKGYHALYTYPKEGYVQSSTSIYEHIDVRGDGGYILVYPSFHPNTGAQYEWKFIEERSFQNLPAYPVVTTNKEFSPSLNKEEEIAQILDSWSTTCPFMRHYLINQSEQSEEVWLAMLTNIARLPKLAPEVAHAASKHYPKYAVNETTQKYLHASSLAAYSCKTIKQWGRCEACAGSYNSPIDNYNTLPDLTDIAPPIVQVVDTRPDLTISDNLLTPGGILQDVMGYIEGASLHSYPLWNLGCALALVGTIAGQKVYPHRATNQPLYFNRGELRHGKNHRLRSSFPSATL